MAAKDLEYDFFEDPPEELTCSVCMKVLCEPHLMNCCGQQFCEHCLEKWLLKNKTCPHCRSADFYHVFMHPTSRKVGNLKVYCPNRQHGCKVVLKISEYEQHLSTTDDGGCLYVKLKCPNDCTAEVFRGEMQGHIQKECPRRLVSCFHCNLQGEHQHITGDHEEECPSYPLLCPRGCKDTVLRKYLEAHQDTCPLERVLCPFHQLGCEAEVCRKDLAKHVDTSALQHMTVLAKSHMALSEQHAVLEAEHAILKEEHVKLAMKHSELEKNCTARKELYSAKVKSVAPIIQSLAPSPENRHLAQIYTILADPSYVKMGDAVDLVLSDSNKKSGSHHFIYTHHEPQSELKFRLEWERVETLHLVSSVESLVQHVQHQYKFYLYFTTGLSAKCGLELCVEVTLNSTNSARKRNRRVLASICCGIPQIGVPCTPGNHSGLLIGTLTVTLDCGNNELITIGVKYTGLGRRQFCGCRCHPPYRGPFSLIGKAAFEFLGLPPPPQPPSQTDSKR